MSRSLPKIDDLTDSMLERIRSRYGALRKSEKAVADFVLQHPDETVSASMAELAQRVGVSHPTIARFCEGMGLDGFKTFKLCLARSLGRGVPYIHQDVGPDDNVERIGEKIFDRAITTLIAVREQLQPEGLEHAVEILQSARKIDIYGLGTSGIVAQDAQLKFFRLGIPTTAYNDPHIQGMAAASLRPGDVALLISASGRSGDMIRNAEIARRSGATTVAVTPGATPLAVTVDLALGLDIPENQDIYTSMTARLAQLTMIDVLSVATALHGGKDTIDRLERVKQTLIDKRVPTALQP